MKKKLTIAEIRGALKTRDELAAEGTGDRALRRAIASGDLRRVQRNRYVPRDVYDSAWPESQHKIEVVAAAEEMRGGSAIAAYAAAAVLHDIPLYRHRPQFVDLTLADGFRMSSNGRVRRHEDFLPDEDIVMIEGIRCTSLERTAFDVARASSRETTVACMDAAMRRATVNDRVVDRHAVEQWRMRMRERVGQATGQRGVRQARRGVEFADGRAELPGESVSRVQLVRLGFRDLDLQVPVSSPAGRDYELDIALREVRSFWEFDGKGKYLDLAMRSGKSLDRVLLDEKRREDWIRGTTQWRFCRGEEAHIITPAATAARLAAFGISPPR
jgi:hypothetical protein